MSLYFQATLSRVWSPVGQIRQVQVASQPTYVNFFGALDVLSGHEIALSLPRQNAQMTIHFLQHGQFIHHSHINLDQLVPINHFCRQLEAKLDLSFVRVLVAPFYALFGRPSIDPVVFFKLQLIMLFAGIRSERQLLEHVQVNLAFRWYLGYDLDEEVPDYRSQTKIRERYGLVIFRRFFEQIV